MKDVHILSEGPISYNSRAFLQPILLNEKIIRDNDIQLSFYKNLSPSLTNCDLLIIDSKFYRSWWLQKKDEMFECFRRFNMSTKVLFFDTSDSSGFILGEILPYVKAYYKHQILEDKSHYLRAMYGRRLFSDFYHKNNQVEDSDSFKENIIQVSDANDLKKIKIFWNSGLANYSFFGEYLGRLYRQVPLKIFLGYPKEFTLPSQSRTLSLQCRFNTIYDKESVAFQRKEISIILKNRLQTKKINRLSFYNELKNTKLALSPFGLGEITLKDFEIFITGSLLMKPDMSHLSTWPNFYTNNTYVPFDWDLKNLVNKLEKVLDNYSDYIGIAENAQNIYKHYVNSEEGNNEIALRFVSIVNEELK
jgi:hypothetical protein